MTNTFTSGAAAGKMNDHLLQVPAEQSQMLGSPTTGITQKQFPIFGGGGGGCFLFFSEDRVLYPCQVLQPSSYRRRVLYGAKNCMRNKAMEV